MFHYSARLTTIAQETDPSVVYTSHAPVVAQQFAANGAPGGLDCGVHATLNFEYLIRGHTVPEFVDNVSTSTIVTKLMTLSLQQVIVERRLLMCHEFLNQVYDVDWRKGEPKKIDQTKPPILHVISDNSTVENETPDASVVCLLTYFLFLVSLFLYFHNH